MKSLSPRRAAIFLALMVIAYSLVSLIVKDRQFLSAFGNIGQAVFQIVILFALLLNLKGGRGNRAFWSLLCAGTLLWLGGQSFWIYYENYLHQSVPNATSSDLFFFFHVLPFIAAASLQPHAEIPEGDHRLRLGILDFSLLLLWWIFLYAYVVVPWEYVAYDESILSTHFHFLFVIENLTLILSFAILWMKTQKSWKSIYQHLFIASSMYSFSSLIINIAIDSTNYHTGSLYDLPLIVSMAWLAYAGVHAYAAKPESEPAILTLHTQAVWHSILASLAVFSMPILALFTVVGSDSPDSVRRYRMFLTLGSMLVLMLLLFLKQRLMDRKLIVLLRESRESYDNLQKLQGHLLQAEKLASIGRLVAGAAHEINNPLTAIFGYSDLLVEQPSLDSESREFAEKIRQQARRTKALVNNLLTFAKQTPMRRAQVDLNSISEKALRLRDLDIVNKNIETVTKLDPNLPPVYGDENQLLQVFLHILTNAVDAMVDHNHRGTLTVSTYCKDERACWSCADTGPGVSNPTAIFDPFFTTKAVGKGTGLGLSVSYGVIRDHRGEITCFNRPEGGAVFVISIPIAESELSTRNDATKVADLVH